MEALVGHTRHVADLLPERRRNIGIHEHGKLVEQFLLTGKQVHAQNDRDQDVHRTGEECARPGDEAVQGAIRQGKQPFDAVLQHVLHVELAQEIRREPLPHVGHEEAGRIGDLLRKHFEAARHLGDDQAEDRGEDTDQEHEGKQHAQGSQGLFRTGILDELAQLAFDGHHEDVDHIRDGEADDQRRERAEDAAQERHRLVPIMDDQPKGEQPHDEGEDTPGVKVFFLHGLPPLPMMRTRRPKKPRTL